MDKILVIARVGDDSLHQEWKKPLKHKNFNLCLSYYGDDKGCFKEQCDFYFESKGTKWPVIKEIIQSLGSELFQYDAIWFPDDDLRTNATNIIRMFEIFMEQNFDLAQPALTKDSFFSHFITLENKNFRWRYTAFAEIMAPVFSRSALKKCWPSFNETGAMVMGRMP